MRKEIIYWILGVSVLIGSMAGSGAQGEDSPAGSFVQAVGAGEAGRGSFSAPKSAIASEVPGSSDAPQIPQPLSLPWAKTEALDKNPEILATKKKWEAAQARVPQARSLNDPQLGWTVYGDSIETRAGPMENVFSFSQKFPFFGKLELRGKIAQEQANSTEGLLKNVQLKIMAAVKNAYYDLYLLEKSIQITGENVELVKNFAQIALTKYKAGQVPQQDVLRAQVELAALENDLLILKEKKESARAGLNKLLNRPTISPLGEVQDFELSPFRMTFAELAPLARQNAAELASLNHIIKKAKAGLALARKNYYPDLMLGLQYWEIGRAGGMRNGDDAWAVRMSINLPIWRDRLKAAVLEAEAQVAKAEADYQEMENITLFQVKDALVKVETAQRSAVLYQTTIIPQAEQTLKVSTTLYQAGKLDFLTLIDNWRMLLKFRLEYFKQLAEFEKSRADLERAVGVELVNISPR